MDSSIGYQNYSQIAAKYVEISENRPLNKYLERPAIRSLLPDVQGKLVVDAGCGSGVLSEWLVSQQANLIAFDVSSVMTQATKERIGVVPNNSIVRVASLEEPLEFIKSSSVDVVICSLVLDYISDWLRVFKEINRILVPNGYLIFSCTHPFEFYRRSETGNYFTKELLELEWKMFDEPYPVIKVYRRSLTDIWASLIEANLFPETLLEPCPVEEYYSLDPDGFNKLNTRPKLLCVKAKRQN